MIARSYQFCLLIGIAFFSVAQGEELSPELYPLVPDRLEPVVSFANPVDSSGFAPAQVEQDSVTLADEGQVPQTPQSAQWQEPSSCQTCSKRSRHCECCKKTWWRSQTEWWRNQTEAQECFTPKPFGFCVATVLDTQVTNAAIDQQVLYNYDFKHPDTRRVGELSERGRAQLMKIAKSMEQTGYPVVIQSTSTPEFDAQRRETVLQHLAELGMPAEPESVAVSSTPTVGIGGKGERAFARKAASAWTTTYENRLQQTFERGSRQLLKTLGR